MSFAGGCLCGLVRYQVNRRYLNAVHCYCEMCRKAHGTAFSTHVICRPDQLSWVQGKSDLVAFQSSADAFREFCRCCGSHILVHGQTQDGTVAVPAGTLDGRPPISLLSHIFVEELVPWYQIEDALPQYDGWPPGVGTSD